ncbi:MAG TPA: hypothetical protein VLM40_02885 [Gemmata sp.]|nr:hypothetical protein [Gemmata sp.]
MAKMLRSFALFAAIIGLTAATSLNTPAPAQEKKLATAEVSGAQADLGTIEVYTDKKDQWRYRVRVSGKSIAIGTVGYKTKAECLKVVEQLKTIMAKGKVVEIEEKKGK